ncbi:hypothetical protein E4T38_03343 [Aureobasidium subglaciale]|nr:hypothetical protein E4T38_03343 [Aureobasidium subglaciale]KAI5226136.1 hypothetical protein E4T40_03280 [Aureobasidium subglaciale]KAI5229492.1 hypothetical protein E4T41_03340 [Aureobasidium subglaciale]KAI5264196.1 hypothetical protein E4T46_03118 [Aureobasidium subglaciale]
MVTIEQVRASNAQIAKSLPPGLVAVFVGGTNGVGEVTVKQFAKHAVRPRVYIIGRSKEAVNRIISECKAINPDGTYIPILKELSLLKNVDEVCKDILVQETHINLLLLTIGTLQAGLKTAEGLHYAAALLIYSRNRFISNLLPAIERAPHLKRVISVFLGSMEGKINMSDFQGWNLGLMENKGHAASITTLALENHAAAAPKTTFIHTFPGPVKGGILRGTKGFGFGLAKAASKFLLPLVQMPPQDAGDRHVFLATSARYPAKEEGNVTQGVSISTDVDNVVGSDGGPGVYSLFLDGQALKQPARQVLAEYRKDGTLQKVWSMIEKEFVNIKAAMMHSNVETVPYEAGRIVKTDVEIDLSALGGKSVVITGAARGLGRAYAEAFAAAGAFVTIGDIDIEAANDLVAKLDGEAIAVRCDVREWKDQLDLFENAIHSSTSRSIDIVIANAGLGGAGDPMMVEQDPDELPSEPALATTDVNLKGLLYTTKLATHYFRRFQKRDGRKDRCLILKSSMAGFIDWPKALQYPASKAAVRMIMKCLRRTVWKDGIRVNVVAPAFVDTGIIPEPFKSKLIAAGMQFASIDDAVKAVLRISCDPTIHGRSLAVIPRAFSPEGYVDLESDDMAPGDNLYVFEQMALSMKV